MFGKREWLYPRVVKGRFYRWREVTSWVLLAALFAGPFLSYNGQPLFLFNILERKFNFFGVTFWPQDFYLVAIGLLAFWTENTQSFSFAFSRLELVLGGVLIPIEIFPQPLRGIAQVLPFSAMLYGPSRILVGFQAGLFAQLVLQQLLTLLVAGALLLLLYTIAARRVSINGG